MMRVAWVLLVLGLMIGACGESDAGFDPSPPLCALARPNLECVSDMYTEHHLLLEASSFGTDARFIATDDRFVLVARSTEPDLLVSVSWFLDVEDDRHDTMHALPAGLEAIDLLAPHIGEAWVLGCDASTCQLLRYDEESDLIVEPNSAFPRTFEPKGLATSHHYIERIPVGSPSACVYGNGLMCFDGTQWITELSDETIVAATTSSASHAALTADGRVLLRADDDSPWTTLSGLHISDPRFIDQHVTPAGDVRVGTQVDPGTWAWIDVDGTVERCNLGVPYLALRSGEGSTTAFHGLSATHSAIAFHESSENTNGYCSRATVPLDTVIDLTTTRCGIIPNERLLTPNQLWGDTFCAID